ncbi:testis development-related protein [Poecilia reticulata]|uniref:testis development-related protein n=1 Tax=Poecilia reticulata TaxID=8081 RepID=UPI0004A319A6|nr:PREDICTED: testis development-related protein-like [Poecilia reticulata]
MNPMWKVYKGKVMKTLNPEYEEDTAEEVTEVEHDMSPIQEDEGPNAVSQLARKMQGASAKSWNRFSSLFNKEDEHQLLEETECPPAADHPLAAKPEEPPRPTRRSGFWDSFATNFAAKKQAEAAAAAAAAADEGVAESGEEGVTQAAGEEQQVGPAEETEAGSSSSNNSFSKYVTLGGSGEDASFKWNFVTSKLAELKTKGMVNKTN